MKLKLLLVFIIIFNFFCDEEPQVKEDNVKPRTDTKNVLTGFLPACTTYTDEAIIKIFTKDRYNRDSVNVKILFENMMAKKYPVCKDMKLNFPLYPIIQPTVKVKDVVDSMDYQFDTLYPGETIIKDFDFSRYCYFDSGSYNVCFLFTKNAAEFKDKKMEGLRLNSFSLNVK